VDAACASHNGRGYSRVHGDQNVTIALLLRRNACDNRDAIRASEATSSLVALLPPMICDLGSVT